MNNKKKKEAYAIIKGGEDYPGISGRVRFLQNDNGVLVTARISGLPEQDACCGCGVFGFHIHEGTDCGGEGFSDTKGHFNPMGCEHPYHAGDLPPLFSNSGYAYMSVLTDRFYLDRIAVSI